MINRFISAIIFLSAFPTFAETAVCTSVLTPDRRITIEFDPSTRQVTQAVFSNIGHDSVADTELSPGSYEVENRGHGEIRLIFNGDFDRELFNCEGTRPE